MPLTKARLARLKKLTDWIEKTKDSLRYDSLMEFARRNRVDYDIIKKDAIEMSYASLPSERGFDMRYVPRSHRRGALNIRTAFMEGKLSEEKVGKASKIFLEHTPAMDVERMNRLYRMRDREILGIQRTIAENITDAMKWKTKLAGIHPAKAYSDAWLNIGTKLHHEIKEALEKVPKEELELVIRGIWFSNLHRSRAHRNYEKVRADYLGELRKMGITTAFAPGKIRWERLKKRKQHLPASLPRFFKERKLTGKLSDAEWVWRALQSDYKSWRKHYKPQRPSPLPRNLKDTFKSLYMRIPDEAKRNLEMESDPFMRFVYRSGKRLVDADNEFRRSRRIWESVVSRHLGAPQKKRRRRLR